MMMNEMFHFLTAGAALFGIRTLFGNSITKYTVNYLGQRRGDFAAGAIYFISFFYITNKLNKYENKDINYLINAREMSGEIYLNTCLHLFPNKVNLEFYRKIMLEK